MSEIKEMTSIKFNKNKFLETTKELLNSFFTSLASYVKTISERTLSITTVVILHSIFVPSLLAYLNSITEKLPSLDSVILVLSALSIMAFNAILKNDRLLVVTHLTGFIINSVILSMVIFK